MMTLFLRILSTFVLFCGLLALAALIASAYGALHFNAVGFENISEMCIDLAILSAVTMLLALYASVKVRAWSHALRALSPAHFCHVVEPL